jgi:hypothetical protein
MGTLRCNSLYFFFNIGLDIDRHARKQTAATDSDIVDIDSNKKKQGLM